MDHESKNTNTNRDEQKVTCIMCGHVPTSWQLDRGAELYVRDQKGRSLLGLIYPEASLTERGTYLVGKDARGHLVSDHCTDLMALGLGFRIAEQTGAKHVVTRNPTVYDWWSHGHVKTYVNYDTPHIAATVTGQRASFEQRGGQVTLRK